MLLILPSRAFLAQGHSGLMFTEQPDEGRRGIGTLPKPTLPFLSDGQVGDKDSRLAGRP
jgi:hypothetical protein